MIRKLDLAALAAGVAMALAAASPTSAAKTPSAGLVADADALLARITALPDDAGCPAALADQIDALVARKDFAKLDAPRRDALLFDVLVCRGYDARATAAARLLDRDDAAPPLVVQANIVLMIDAADHEDGAGQLRAMERVAALDPTRLAAFPPDSFNQAVSDLKTDPAGQARALDLLRALEWPTEDGHHMVDNAWALRRAELAADAGDMTRAAAVLDRASDVAVLAAVAQDLRFAPLWPDMQAAGRFDWIKLVEAQLARGEEQSRREPGRLDRVVDRIDTLRTLGRWEEARALGADYAARLARGERFDDLDDQRPWLLTSYAQILADLGQTDAADAQMVASVGEDRISQHLARAGLLVDAGRDAQALKVLAEADMTNARVVGLQWARALRACANVHQGDKAAGERELPALRKDRRQEAAALSTALLCLGRQDEAAALMVERLDDPEMRREALNAFRTGRQPPVISPGSKELNALRAALLARPEVRATLRKYGRTLELPLAGPYDGGV